MRHTVAAPTVAASAGPGRRSAPGQGGVGRRAATALAAATIGASAPTKKGSAAEMRAPSLRRVVRTPRDRVQAYLQNPPVTALLHPRPPRAASGGGAATCEDVAAVGGSSNGRTSGFGPENRGSNPCPPATDAG